MMKNTTSFSRNWARGLIDGKDHGVCHSYVKDGWLPPHGPNRVVRYGCGKCQVAVPCERGIPGRK